MRVFLTGATGFIGAHVARQLLNAGDEVTILVRPQALEESRLGDMLDRLDYHVGDVFEPDQVRDVLRGREIDVAIHLAWYAEPGKYLDSLENLRCQAGSLTLIEALAESGCPHVVMIGTCAEYDCDQGYLREESPVRPATVYAAAKLGVRYLGEQVAERLGIGFTWARLFHLYGPGEDSRRLVPALIRTLRNDEVFLASTGDQIRDYLNVGDVASALITLARRRVAGVYNVASGQPMSVRQLMETVWSACGKRGQIEFGAKPARNWEPPFIVGDSTKLRSLGWVPSLGLEEGLRGMMVDKKPPIRAIMPQN